MSRLFNYPQIIFVLLTLLSMSAYSEKQLITSITDVGHANFGLKVGSVGDIDQDGRDEIYISSSSGLHVYDSADLSFIRLIPDGVIGDTAGDVNNDGYGDIVVGYPSESLNGWQSGAVRVISGVDGAELYELAGPSQGGANLGTSVSGLGDINGDGYDDFIAGAPYYYSGAANRGMVRVYSGADGAVIYEITGDQPDNYTGQSVDGIGDINNDGYPDFIVGSPSDYENGMDAGTARLYSGIDGSELYIHIGDADGDEFGEYVSRAGDVNNDGYQDYMVTALKEDEFLADNDVGSVSVFSGVDGALIHKIYGNNISTAASDFGRFGYSLSPAGDVDQDGYEDIMVSELNPEDATNLGGAYVYKGIDGTLLYSYQGSVANGFYGRSASFLGDYNSDGYPDVIVSNYKNNSVDVMSGRALPGRKDDYSNNGIAGWIWRGTSNGVEGVQRIWEPDWGASTGNWIIPSRTYPPDWDATLEYDIVTTGDFNGDGDTDWLWRAVGNGDGRWKIWQIEGGFRSGQNNPPVFDTSHEWAVIGAGDTDRDGDDDLILNNTSTGEVMIWEMNNYLIANSHSVGIKAGYDVVRVGDFDRDGDVDLLLQIQGGTTLRFWEIENNGFVQELTTQQTGAGFDTACAGDFDGDGDDDVYLLAADGTSKFFEYENFVRQQQVFGANQSAFVFYGCGDFDGDGTMDTQWTSADGLGYNRILILDNFSTEKTYYTNRYGGTDPGNPGYGYERRGNRN